MSEATGRRRKRVGSAAWPLTVVLAAVLGAGCAGRREARDAAMSPPGPAAADAAPADGSSSDAAPADLAPADGGGESLEAASNGAVDASGVPGPTYEVAARDGLLWVRGPEGGATALEVHAEAMLGGSGGASEPRAWRRDGRMLVAETSVAGADWRIVVETDPARPVLVIRVGVRYAADTVVEQESLVLGLPAATAPEVLGRDLVRRAVEPGKAYVTDPWTPLEVHAETPAGPITLVRAGGFPSATTEQTDDGLTARLELDDAGNHPFRPYAECHRRYAASHPRETLDATPRRAGERVEHAAELWLGETTPLRAGRFPAGRRAAVVLTSHADQATAARTRAVLWGHSNRDHETYGRRGLLGHGLSLTLTAFAEDGVQDDLGDAAYAETIAEAAAAGVEIGPHSVTARPDDRATVERLLTALDRFAPVTWIDHGPDTNCEAVMNGPALPGRGSPYEIAGLLRAHGYRYVWTEPDLEPPDGGLNLLAPRHPERRPIVLFRNANYRDGEWVPWMFRTAWLFVERGTLVERLAPRALERLAAEQGVLLAHVYLEAYETGGRRANRTLLEPDGAGFRVRDDADAAFAALGEAQASGSLWVPSLRSLGDHWTAAAEVQVLPRADGTVVLRGGTRGVTAMAWSVPWAGLAITVDGRVPDGVRADDDGTTFWVDVPAGTERVVAATVDGVAVRLYPAGRTIAAD